MKELLASLHRHIPLSEKMQVSVAESSADKVVLSAPLKPNINHQRTAFGGSLHSLAVLAGWSLVTEAMRSEKLSVDYLVIQKSEMNYLLPVRQEFTAVAEWSSAQRSKFLGALQRKGLARVEIVVEILSEDKVCARLQAHFVASLT